MPAEIKNWFSRHFAPRPAWRNDPVCSCTSCFEKQMRLPPSQNSTPATSASGTPYNRSAAPSIRNNVDFTVL